MVRLSQKLIGKRIRVARSSHLGVLLWCHSPAPRAHHVIAAAFSLAYAGVGGVPPLQPQSAPPTHTFNPALAEVSIFAGGPTPASRVVCCLR